MGFADTKSGGGNASVQNGGNTQSQDNFDALPDDFGPIPDDFKDDDLPF